MEKKKEKKKDDKGYATITKGKLGFGGSLFVHVLRKNAVKATEEKR